MITDPPWINGPEEETEIVDEPYDGIDNDEWPDDSGTWDALAQYERNLER